MSTPLRTQSRRLAAITSHLVPAADPTSSNRPFTSSSTVDRDAASSRAAQLGGRGNERMTMDPRHANQGVKPPDARRTASSWGTMSAVEGAGGAGGSGTGSGSSKPGREPSPWADERKYRYWLPIQTRWQDNDQYGHMNNAIYYHLFDTIANSFLISHCSLDPGSSTSPIGLIVSSNCTYLAPLAFPSPVLAGLTVGKIGRSTIEWRIALWPATASAEDRHGTPGTLGRAASGEVISAHRIAGPCAAFGSFIHVFVDPKTRRSVELPLQTRQALSSLESTHSKL